MKKAKSNKLSKTRNIIEEFQDIIQFAYDRLSDYVKFFLTFAL